LPITTYNKNYFSDTSYFDNPDSSFIFVKLDTDIKKAINKNNDFLNPTDEIIQEFHIVFTSFIDFLEKCGGYFFFFKQ
jgi:hypothetical protein